MPTILSHAAVPLALALGAGTRHVPGRLLIAGVAAAILPDLDVLAFRFHIAYAHVFGHRGASHSLAFALLLGAIAWACAAQLRSNRIVAFCFVTFCAASHGLLDMLTNGTHGVAFWWPWSAERLVFPWRFIEASPLSLHRLWSGRGLDVLQSELLWVWLPAAALATVLLILRRLAPATRAADASDTAMSLSRGEKPRSG